MPSKEISAVHISELAKSDWEKLKKSDWGTLRNETAGSANGRVVQNAWLARINQAKEEKLSRIASLPQRGAIQAPLGRTTSFLNGPPNQAGLTLVGHQTSLEIALAQQQAEEEARGPLKVPIPGPKPQDVRMGVRPCNGLWTALGGGVAVVLNTYVGSGGSSEEAEDQLHTESQTEAPLQHSTCVMSAAWNKSGTHLISGDVSGLAILWDIVSGKAVRAMQAPDGGLSGILRLDWSHEGVQVACSANEGKLVIWDTSTGAVQHNLMGHNTYGAVRTCKFSPDGSKIVSGGDFGICIVWDAATGKLIRKLPGHSDHVGTCSWSPDGSKVISGGADNLLVVSDLESSKKEPLQLEGHITSGNGDLDGITCVTWNPKGQSVASSGRDAHILLHCAKTGKLLHNLIGHTGPVLSCAWSKDGAKLASCAKDRAAIIWDTEGGAALHHLVGHNLSVKSCSWDSAGSRLVTAGADGKLLIWDADAGVALQELESMQESALSSDRTNPLEGIEYVEFSPDDSIIASAGGGGEVIIWDAQPDTLQKVLDSQDSAVKRCNWSPDATKVVSGCESGKVVIWDVEGEKQLHSLSVHSEAISGCEFSPDSTKLVTSSADGKLILWDVGSGKQIFSFIGHRGPIARCEWCSDGNRIVSGGADGKVCIWDASTGKAKYMLKQHKGAVPYCSWSPNGRLIISCGWYDRTVMIWNATNGYVLQSLTGHLGAVTVCRWSPDGRKVVSGGARGEVIVWDALTGDKMATLRGDHDAPEGCSFSPDANMILCYDSSKVNVWSSTMRISKAKSGKDSGRWELLLQLQGHSDLLCKCAWSPDGKYILSAGRDKRVIVWQATTGETIYHLDGHKGGVIYASWSPDGTAIVSGDENSKLLLWKCLPRYSYMAAPGPVLFYFRIRLMHGDFQRDLANATALAHPNVLTARTAEGTTILHLAAQYTDLELLLWLLAFAAEHSFPLSMSNDKSGSSPLDYAIQNQWWQGMSKIVGAVHAGVVKLSTNLQTKLFTSPAFKILLRHFSGDLEPLLQEGSACGVTSVANGFTVADTSGLLLKLGQEGIQMVVAGSNHRQIPAQSLTSFWQKALFERAAQKRTTFGVKQRPREQVDATAVVRLQRVGWAGCAAKAPNGILHCLLRSEVSADMYGLPVVRAVIDLKWWAFARKYVMKELALYTILLAMFTAYALGLSKTSQYESLQEASMGRADRPRSRWCFSDAFIAAMAISVLALVARFLKHEIKQMKMYGRQHWTSFWNWMNAMAFSLYVPVILMHAVGLKNAGAFKVVLATDAVLLWANLLHFAKAFRGTGALVQMVTMTVSDMRWFVLLLFVVMFGFGTSFLVLFSGNKGPSPEFADVDSALLSMFLFMLGSFNMDAFDMAAVPSAAILLFVFYEVVVTVVLLNLLIAIMGESFSKVVENEEQQFLKGRAELIDEVEVALLGNKPHSNPNWFPRYLHILRPGQQSMGGEDSTEDPWGPALVKTEESMAAMIARLQNFLDEQLQTSVSSAVSAELSRFLDQPVYSTVPEIGTWEVESGNGALDTREISISHFN